MDVRRASRVAMVVAGIVTALTAIVVVGSIASLLLFLGGVWPFPPLERVHNEIALTNGGVVHIEAVEQRGWRSDGFTVYSRYESVSGGRLERIGEWEGYEHDPKVFVVDDLVVLPSPDRQTLFVRTAGGRWRFFALRFPDATTSLPMSHYTTLTTLTEEEMRAVVGPLAPGWSPSVSIRGFRAAERELEIECLPDLETIRHARLQLSDDGTDLTLIDVRVEERD